MDRSAIGEIRHIKLEQGMRATHQPVIDFLQELTVDSSKSDSYVDVAQTQWLKGTSEPCSHVAVTVLCPWKRSHECTRVCPSLQMIRPHHMPEALFDLRRRQLCDRQ